MRISIVILFLLLAAASMAQDSPRPELDPVRLDAPQALGWRKNFSGTVTALGDGHLTLQPDKSEEPIVFDIVYQTEAVPSESAVKVGSKVRVVATEQKLIRVEVVPYAEWLKAQTTP